MNKTFDRAAEDLGNSIHLEHVNVQVPDQRLAQLFYAVGLGLTRDPYLMVVRHQHVDQCRAQPVPSADRQGAGRARPHRAGDLRPRGAARPPHRACAASSTARSSASASTTTTSRRSVRGAIACAATSRTQSASGASRSASRTSSSTCRSAARRRSRPSIRRSWARPRTVQNGDGTVTRVQMGKNQYLQFRETDAPQPAFDGHHVQMYIANFSGPVREAEGAQSHLGRGQPVSVPLPGHRRSRQRQGAVHGRARGAQRDAPDVSAPAGQPQSGDDQPELRQRLRLRALGDGPGGIRRTGDAAAELSAARLSPITLSALRMCARYGRPSGTLRPMHPSAGSHRAQEARGRRLRMTGRRQFTCTANGELYGRPNGTPAVTVCTGLR